MIKMDKSWIKPGLQILAALCFVYLLLTVRSIKKDVEKIKEIYLDTVTVTTYTTDPKQTDASPYVTASGFKLNKKNPRSHRVVAISRDLMNRYKFGDRIRIVGAGNLSGVYRVEDVMNRRFTRRIDILINPKDTHTLLRGVRIFKV